jgi:hypothetical protein
MTPYHELRRLAREKRDKAFQTAREEYAATMSSIAALSRSLSGQNHLVTPIDSRTIRGVDKPFSQLSLTAAAERVLRETGPLRIAELTLEVQQRGCRHDQDPRKVVHAIRSALTYHRGRFSKDEQGRWTVA